MDTSFTQILLNSVLKHLFKQHVYYAAIFKRLNRVYKDI
ncbi:unnamed protein product [Larinioides sclopetarius]|uniref:Maturase K n=1 Tax=Larinioides sclopetarius TaxID=280406 RepID=A0AAV2BKI9_9ARAC